MSSTSGMSVAAGSSLHGRRRGAGRLARAARPVVSTAAICLAAGSVWAGDATESLLRGVTVGAPTRLGGGAAVELSDLAPAQPADAPADDGAGDANAELARQLVNPIANLISVPAQFNYDEGFGPEDAGRVTVNIQPVIPFSLNEDWNLITRTIVPIIYQDSPAEGVDSEFGLGDTVQSFFFSPKEPVDGWILGAGPVALWPTGTEPMLRNESLGFGPTAVALRQAKGWTVGAMANHIWSVTNSDDHEQVNATFLQPFLTYTWPTATTLGCNTESTYDWNSSDWTMPLNLQLSQLLRLGGRPVQFQIGGRYYVESPEGGPEWGLRFTVTWLFPK